MSGIEPGIVTIGMKAAAPIVAGAITQTLTYVKSKTDAITDRISRELRVGYSDFLEASFNRCQQVKTIVTGDQPVPLLDVYVNLRLTAGMDVIDDDSLIAKLEQYKRVVITGTGGAGKSMLMKYLTIVRFENPRGRIPLFVELRNLNNITAKEVLPYCFASCSTAQQTVSFSNFEKVFAAGGFILILDGFDEIDSEHKDLIERQILELGRRFPECIIIVSSRNDPRFKGWQDYHVFEVNKLSLQQVRKIIDKLPYESGIKRRFLKELPTLWSTHVSFLSIPLLSVIMLLTFGKFSEISPKATLFYKLAFQTLFREHDANKEQFRRPMFTSLELDDFERSFAAFCALSYLDNKFSFDHAGAVQFTKDAMKYARLKSDPSKYIQDLVQNVCMLQQEGGELTFVHRSFQEYFCAVFLVGYHENNLKDVIKEVASREGDSTLSMFKELDEAKFEIHWLLPTLEDMVSGLSQALATGSAAQALRWIFTRGYFDEGLRLSGLGVTAGSRVAELRQIGKIYSNSDQKLSINRIFRALRPDEFESLLETSGAAGREPIQRLIQQASSGNPSDDQGRLEFSDDDNDWLAQTEIFTVMKSILAELKKIQRQVKSERSSQGTIIVFS